MTKNLEILNELKMQAPVLYQLKEDSFTTREEKIETGYFENLQDLVIAQCNIESFTISEEKMPDDYFSSMQNEVLKELNVSSEKNVLTSWKRYAAVIVLAVTSVFTMNYFLNANPGLNQDDYQVNLSYLEDAELLMALDDYVNKKRDINVMIEHGVLDQYSSDESSEEYEIIEYMDINENEIIESYQNKQ
jgi:hypothetical protein